LHFTLQIEFCGSLLAGRLAGQAGPSGLKPKSVFQYGKVYLANWKPLNTGRLVLPGFSFFFSVLHKQQDLAHTLLYFWGSNRVTV